MARVLVRVVRVRAGWRRSCVPFQEMMPPNMSRGGNIIYVKILLQSE